MKNITRENIGEISISVLDGMNRAFHPTPTILEELPTGFGKTKVALDLINHICKREALKNPQDTRPKTINVLLLVAKRVHKQTWKDEINKWGGLGYDFVNVNLTIECYESLKNYENNYFECVLLDECFKGSTEVLTNKGYKRFDSLEGDELIAQFTDNGDIMFVKPLRFIKRMHNGEICKWHLGRERYCYLTPNHNQVYCTKRFPEWRTKPIKDLHRGHESYIPISGKGTGNNNILTAMERLIVAIQADGTLQRHQRKESVYSIGVTKERKKERLKEILKETCNYTQIKGKPKTDRYIVKLPKGDAKLLSTHFNIDMGYDRANSFIEEVVQWDGCSYLGGNTRYYSSKIKENADFVAAIAVQAGYKVLQSIEKDNRKDSYFDIHRVYMRKLEKINLQPLKKEYISYNDYVYCVEVPSHKIVVRSEGYSFISGNCHHIGSDLRLDLLKTLTITELLLGLSATIPKDLKKYFKYNYNAEIISCSLQDAFNTDTLPEPIIYLYPMRFDIKEHLEDDTFEVIYNKNKGLPRIYANWSERGRFRFTKNKEIHTHCTKVEYLRELNSEIESLKLAYQRNPEQWRKTKWLRRSKDRLEFLSSCKNDILKRMLGWLDKERTLTFCSTIEQTEILGANCIHSKNKNSTQVLEDFNAGRIDHITSCQVLNEGVNLTNCRVGIYANINASEIITRQRLGRILRHPKPMVIIPYYVNTREEELVKKMIKEYDPSLIKGVQELFKSYKEEQEQKDKSC